MEWPALIKAVEGEEDRVLQTKIRKFEEILESEIKQACLAKTEPLEAREYVYRIRQAWRRMLLGYEGRDEIKSYRDVLDDLCNHLDTFYFWSL